MNSRRQSEREGEGRRTREDDFSRRCDDDTKPIPVPNHVRTDPKHTHTHTHTEEQVVNRTFQEDEQGQRSEQYLAQAKAFKKRKQTSARVEFRKQLRQKQCDGRQEPKTRKMMIMMLMIMGRRRSRHETSGVEVVNKIDERPREN
jgi:hypothetical protein